MRADFEHRIDKKQEFTNNEGHLKQVAFVICESSHRVNKRLTSPMEKPEGTSSPYFQAETA